MTKNCELFIKYQVFCVYFEIQWWRYCHNLHIYHHPKKNLLLFRFRAGYCSISPQINHVESQPNRCHSNKQNHNKSIPIFTREFRRTNKSKKRKIVKIIRSIFLNVIFCFNVSHNYKLFLVTYFFGELCRLKINFYIIFLCQSFCSVHHQQQQQ